MAQMRVKDQDLIVEQVVSKIEASELEKFKAREDVQSIQNEIESKIKTISRLVEQYNGLENNIKSKKKELNELVRTFQEANSFEREYSNTQGLSLNGGYQTNNIPTCKAVWQMPYTTRYEISTKLRLQTMSGDFNVYELIQQLVNEFSN
jgi:predicted RNase H-like nuclease (RuvC/YqgF family)